MKPLPSCRICGKPCRRKNARAWAVCGYACHRERENRRNRSYAKRKAARDAEKRRGDA